MSDLPPAGWYPDPSGVPNDLRYWDGAHWTEHRHDASTRLFHDAAEGWNQGPDGRWQPPDDGRTYGIARTEVESSGWDPGVYSNRSAIPAPVPQSGRAWFTYWTDLKWSARALVASPWLVILSVALFAIFELGVRHVHPVALWRLLAFAVEVFYIGLAGTQRVWFLRKARGIPIRPVEVWSLSWSFFGRYLCLDLLFAGPVLAVLIPLIVVNTHQVVSSTGLVQMTTDTSSLTVAFVVLSFVGDVVLTFVVPALALTTRSLKESFRVAWQVTKTSWPNNVWYLFAPGITLVALVGTLPRSVISTGGVVALGLFSTLLALLFKGANVAFYMRTMPPVGVDGAANA